MKIYRPKDSKGRPRPKWYITFCHNDRHRRVAVSSNKKATEKIATAIDGMLACNGSLAPDLQVFIETMNPKLRDVLTGFGVIGRQYMPSIHAGKTLADHVKDFGDSLKAKGNSLKYAGQAERAIQRIFDCCGFDSIADIDANRLYTHLADMRGDSGCGERNFNWLLHFCKHFCKWLVRERRADSSPLEHLGCIKQTENRRKRRALTLDEQRRLIKASANGKKPHSISGTERAMLYRVALQTGLRANELRSLTVSSFDFDDRTVNIAGGLYKE